MPSAIRLSIIAIVLVLSSTAALAQAKPEDAAGPIRSSPAFAEVLLRTTEVRADIEAFGADYTETSTRMMDLRAELKALTAANERLFRIRPSETGKLTLAIGKLLVRKAALEADVARLSRSYTPDHADVKRARKKLEIYESSIKEVLP